MTVPQVRWSTEVPERQAVELLAAIDVISVVVSQWIHLLLHQIWEEDLNKNLIVCFFNLSK